ncbi:hypothetical protein WA026_015555 [Henosepilachna vigintioctopunctata]|uniref:Uncharacterized protein n=1 Tax=Henosepilachna vigintioctopunctata TaxID=420089 RepID=A0AAW1VA62_9CUCU
MITMRSSSVPKMVKPPPPVPPRPSKTIVAEALAKRRRNPEDSYTIPVRSAPPPPLNLSGSQTNGRVNFSLKKPTSYERSISDELKSNTRTVVFQSSNIKSVNNSVLVRKDSINKVTLNNNFCNPGDRSPNNKTTREVEKNSVANSKNTVNSCDISVINADNLIKIKQMNESLENKESVDSSSDEVTVNSENIVTCVVPISTPQITEKQTEIMQCSEELIESKTASYFDEKRDNKRDSFDEKWEEMLKDKNHVNMLIDEMFSSVLEVSKNEDLDKRTSCETIPAVFTDTTTITISGCDKKCESTDANGSTLLVIENGDNQKNDTHTLSNGKSSNGNSLTKIGHSTEKLDCLYDKSNSSTMEKKNVHFDDKKNAELLIEELESMRVEQERILKRQRKPSQEIYDGEECDKEEKMENCHINIVNLNSEEKGMTLDYER